MRDFGKGERRFARLGSLLYFLRGALFTIWAKVLYPDNLGKPVVAENVARKVYFKASSLLELGLLLKPGIVV